MYYQTHEGHLPLEGPWQDQSVNVLVPRTASTQGTNIVISRDLLPMGMDFETYLGTQRKTFEKELPDFQILHDASESLDEQSAPHLFEFTWKSQGGLLHQLMRVLCREDRILSLTATVPDGMDEETRQAMLATLQGFRYGPVPIGLEDARA